MAFPAMAAIMQLAPAVMEKIGSSARGVAQALAPQDPILPPGSEGAGAANAAMVGSGAMPTQVAQGGGPEGLNRFNSAVAARKNKMLVEKYGAGGV